MRSTEAVWAFSQESAPTIAAKTPPAPKPPAAAALPSKCPWLDRHGAVHAVADTRCAKVDVPHCEWSESTGSRHYLEEVREDDELWASCLQTILAEEGCAQMFPNPRRSLSVQTCEPDLIAR